MGRVEVGVGIGYGVRLRLRLKFHWIREPYFWTTEASDYRTVAVILPWELRYTACVKELFKAMYYLNLPSHKVITDVDVGPLDPSPNSPGLKADTLNTYEVSHRKLQTI